MQQNLPQIRRIFRQKYGNKAGNFTGLEQFVILPNSDINPRKQRVRQKIGRCTSFFVSM